MLLNNVKIGYQFVQQKFMNHTHTKISASCLYQPRLSLWFHLFETISRRRKDSDLTVSTKRMSLHENKTQKRNSAIQFQGAEFQSFGPYCKNFCSFWLLSHQFYPVYGLSLDPLLLKNHYWTSSKRKILNFQYREVGRKYIKNGRDGNMMKIHLSRRKQRLYSARQIFAKFPPNMKDHLKSNYF